MRITTLAAAGLAATLFAVPAIAHHSFAMFDNSQTVHLEGTVTDLEWINPHVWLHIEVAGEDGTAQVWSFEGGSTGQLQQSLWTPETVVPGEAIEVGFHPLKDGSNGGQLLEVTKEDGSWFCQGGACREELRARGIID
jgi:hypothetical protein